MEPTLQEQKTVVLNWYSHASVPGQSAPGPRLDILAGARGLGPTARRCSTSDWDPDDAEPLVIDGSIQGNISCKFNDCRLDPFTAKRKGTVCGAAGGHHVSVVRFPQPQVAKPPAPDASPGAATRRRAGQLPVRGGHPVRLATRIPDDPARHRAWCVLAHGRRRWPPLASVLA